MSWNSLRLLHLSKSDPNFRGSAPKLARLAHKGFFLDTCQRQFLVYHLNQGISEIDRCGLDLFEGKEAYRFLLRVATGLESAIQGETDIFGQLKSSWQSLQETAPHLSELLSPWMHKVFEDTKEIRSLYIQNLGGESYGSLIRKILKEQSLQGPVLFFGAGQIAASVAPWIKEQKIAILNRSIDRAHELARLLKSDHKISADVLTPEQLPRSWSKSQIIVVCIPAEAAAPNLDLTDKTVIHLGGRSEECSAWSAARQLFTLDDLFELQKELSKTKQFHLAQAARACEERARLRELAAASGSSINTAQGWEDLALFSTS